jgi:predicted O-methyltransferase YrrM
MPDDTSRPTDWAAVDTYLGDLLAPTDPAHAAVLDANEAAGLPRIDVSPAQGKMLALFARMIGARRILEIGTLGGYSTIWMARALPPGGELITIEAEPRHADVATANIAHAGLAGVVKLCRGKALDVLPTLTGPFDMIFIDADKSNMPAYLEWALRLTRKGGIIIGDNVVRDGAVTDGRSRSPTIVGVRSFLDMLAREPRLEATAIQTVGEKGWDGFALAVVIA